jgi:hypothetical protein
MDVPSKLLLGNEAKGRGGGAVSAPGVKINELDSAHGLAFSHSSGCPDNLPIAYCKRRGFLPPVILSEAKDLCSCSEIAKPT